MQWGSVVGFLGKFANRCHYSFRGRLSTSENFVLSIKNIDLWCGGFKVGGPVVSGGGGHPRCSRRTGVGNSVTCHSSYFSQASYDFACSVRWETHSDLFATLHEVTL